MEINKWRFTHTHILWSNTFLQLIYHYSYILYFVSFSPPYMIPLLLCQTVTSLCMRPNCANDKLWLEYESEVRWSQVRFLSAAARRHLVVGRMYDSLQENRHQRTVRTAGHPESSQVPYDPQTTDMMVLQSQRSLMGDSCPRLDVWAQFLQQCEVPVRQWGGSFQLSGLDPDRRRSRRSFWQPGHNNKHWQYTVLQNTGILHLYIS